MARKADGADRARPTSDHGRGGVSGGSLGAPSDVAMGRSESVRAPGGKSSKAILGGRAAQRRRRRARGAEEKCQRARCSRGLRSFARCVMPGGVRMSFAGHV